MASMPALQAVDLVQRAAQGSGVEGLEVPLDGILVVDEYPIDECFHLYTGTVVCALAKQTKQFVPTEAMPRFPSMPTWHRRTSAWIS